MSELVIRQTVVPAAGIASLAVALTSREWYAKEAEYRSRHATVIGRVASIATMTEEDANGDCFVVFPSPPPSPQGREGAMKTTTVREPANAGFGLLIPLGMTADEAKEMEGRGTGVAPAAGWRTRPTLWLLDLLRLAVPRVGRSIGRVREAALANSAGIADEGENARPGAPALCLQSLLEPAILTPLPERPAKGGAACYRSRDARTGIATASPGGGFSPPARWAWPG